MKKTKFLGLSVLAVSAIVLSACGGTSSSSSQTTTSGNVSSIETSSSTLSNSESSNITTSSETNSQTSQSNHSSSISSSSSVAKKNVIYCEENAHATITPSVDMAAFGEVVELDIKIENGYELDKITVNNEVIDGTSFVMPIRGAYIVVSVFYVNASGMMLTGDISEPLIKDNETGLWVARNVKCSKNTTVIYSINGEKISVIAITNEKTFADILLPAAGVDGFVVSGGATYDFYYDPTDKIQPCFVKRTKVDLPQTPEALETLFDGSVGSETCVYPDGVTKVEYESSTRNDKYVWELYADNSSLATVQDYNGRKEKGIVYKSIDNNVYTVVDSYIENHTGTDTTSTERSDTTKYAGRYDVVSTITPGYRKYQYTNRDAVKDAVKYSHNMESIDFDIMHSYRTGFKNDISDDIYTYDIKVVSIPNADGSFNTSVRSWVSVKRNGASSGVSASYHVEYEVDLVFTGAGALLEVTYNHKEYSDKQYDFERNQFKTGGIDDPVSEKDMYCKYTYGEAKTTKPNIDISKYFVSSITDLKIVDSKGEDSEINRMDTLEMFVEASNYAASGKKYVSCTFAPATALDVWQYGIVDSSNKSVVNNRKNDPVQYPFEWEGNQGGTTTLTIGNHTKNTGVKGSFETTSPDQVNNIKTVWVYSVNEYNNENWNSSSGKIYAGGKDKVKITATLVNNSYDQYPDVEIVSSNPDFLKAEYKIEDGYLYLDATGALGITSNTSITLTVNARYADNYGPSKLYVTILPALNNIESVEGDWDLYDPNGSAAAAGFNASIKFTEGTTKNSGTGSITVVDGTDTYVVSFEYAFNPDTQTIKASKASTTKNGSKFGSSTSITFDINVDTGYIGVYCGISSYSVDSENEMSESVFVLLGDYIEDGDGYGEYLFDDFTKRA